MSDEASKLRSNRLIAADIEAIGPIGAVPSILEMVCKSTGLRFAVPADHGGVGHLTIRRVPT